MTATLLNGNARTQRKSLNDQIDRLDNILDGLAESLNESVADAVKQAVAGVVQHVVETAIKEVLSNPVLLRTVSPQQPGTALPEVPSRRTFKDVLRDVLLAPGNVALGTLTQTGSFLSQTWSWCLRVTGSRLRQFVNVSSLGLHLLNSAGKQLWILRHAVGIALGVGGLVALGVYHSPPVVASALCGLCSAVLTAGGLLVRPVVQLLLTK